VVLNKLQKFSLYIFFFWTVVCFANIETDRLILRSWNDGDVDYIYEMIQDPEVNYYLKHVHLDEYTVLQQLAKRANKNIEENGFGYFVCELKSTGEVIGFAGLNYIQLDDPHFPCYTVSWVLGKKYWKNGYATEAGQALLDFGFESCKIPKIFACTNSGHIDSRRVMHRLDMQLDDTFHFPGIEESNPLREQVLYKITKN
jgi:RimJ/RimL family protein N-acetyltransferase